MFDSREGLALTCASPYCYGLVTDVKLARHVLLVSSSTKFSGAETGGEQLQRALALISAPRKRQTLGTSVIDPTTKSITNL